MSVKLERIELLVVTSVVGTGDSHDDPVRRVYSFFDPGCIERGPILEIDSARPSPANVEGALRSMLGRR